jgi:hypothetical protein
MRSHEDRPKLTQPAVFLGILLLLQLSLGAAAYLGKFTSVVRFSMGSLVLLTTTHLVTGALMLVTSLLLTLRSCRLSISSKPKMTQKLLTEQFSG